MSETKGARTYQQVPRVVDTFRLQKVLLVAAKLKMELNEAFRNKSSLRGVFNGNNISPNFGPNCGENADRHGTLSPTPSGKLNRTG